MNFFENKGEAVVKFFSGDFQVIRPGAYVKCAISGAHIPLDHLQYWDADKQEAYASFEESAKALSIKLHSSDKK
ncbi:DUF2093 domain-containing protein [Microvirga sp. W0021]|uniref:DUF2093 domain-containing protein n=1 Tax=Hohaiivirga grylli TaxID=3133970 RepID=A0ABV0BHA4_9HYPH